MHDLLAAIEASGLAAHLRASRWTYPLVNAAHVMGLALLFGSIAPLDLRLLGLWRNVPIGPLRAVLRPVSATGAALAVITGALLFAVNAREYAGLGLFQAKMALVALGLANAALLAGPRLDTLSPAALRLAGGASLAIWIAAILCGRIIGYL